MSEGIPRKPSSRTMVPRVCNAALWLMFCGLSGTGLLLAFRLPPGSRGGKGLSALGWGRHDWGDLHLWLSYGFLALVLIHLALHWRWFWQIAAKKRAWPILLGIFGGITLMLTLALLPVKGDDTGEGPGRKGNHRQYRAGQNR